MNYNLIVSVDSEFELNLNPQEIGIKSHQIPGNLFLDKDFFKRIPIISLLDKLYNANFSDEIINDILSNISGIDDIIYNETKGVTYHFKKNNIYDLESVFFDKDDIYSKRLLIQLINNPISSLYIIEGVDKVSLSPSNKSYYTISNEEWYYFIENVKSFYNKSGHRDMKLNIILNENSDLELSKFNLLRQLRHIVEHESSHHNTFLTSVWMYYKKKGYITDKQYKAVKDTIW